MRRVELIGPASASPVGFLGGRHRTIWPHTTLTFGRTVDSDVVVDLDAPRTLDARTPADEPFTVGGLELVVREVEAVAPAPRSPLGALMTKLAAAYDAGDDAAVLAELALRRRTADAMWAPYWRRLSEALDEHSETSLEIGDRKTRRRARMLAVLATAAGQPLAKAIVRRWGRQSDMPLSWHYVVRIVSGYLDAQRDEDAAVVVYELLGTEWKSFVEPIGALIGDDLDRVLPAMKRQICNPAQANVYGARDWAGRRPEPEAFRLLQLGATNPSWGEDLALAVRAHATQQELAALPFSAGRALLIARLRPPWGLAMLERDLRDGYVEPTAELVARWGDDGVALVQRLIDEPVPVVRRGAFNIHESRRQQIELAMESVRTPPSPDAFVRELEAASKSRRWALRFALGPRVALEASHLVPLLDSTHDDIVTFAAHMLASRDVTSALPDLVRIAEERPAVRDDVLYAIWSLGQI